MPLETRHLSFFWRYPINYLDTRRNQLSTARTEVAQVGDNDYDTHIVTNGLKIVTSEGIGDDLSPTGDPTSFTHLFVKSKGVDRINVSFTGSSIPEFTFPTTIVNSSNRYTRLDPDGYQNILFRVNDDGSASEASEITISFTALSGQSSQIYEVMVLDQSLIMSADRRFTTISYSLADRASILQKDIAERITKVPGINEDRWKWDVDYETTFRGEELNPFQQDGSLIDGVDLLIDNLDGMLYNRLINFIKNRSNNNFGFCGEYPRYPERVYPATFPNPDMQMAFLSDFKASGENIKFTVIEL